MTAAEAPTNEVPDADDTLIMLFPCCHPAFTAVSQTALTLFLERIAPNPMVTSPRDR